MHFATYYRWLVYSFLFSPLGFGAPRQRLLDIGSKEGAFAAHLAATVDRIVCLDLKLPRARSAQVEFALADGQHLPFADATFDCILMNDVLEHIPRDQLAVHEACRVLQLGGVIWLSTPALHYFVGPEWVTQRFERAWGHVRRGYHPDQLCRLFPVGMEVHVFTWDEPCIRALQLPLWVISRRWMRLARSIARRCFEVDRRVYSSRNRSAALNGHLYLYAHKVCSSV
ncbi:MAG: methyltransferase domain-containing protein [Anaerolineae bacterium]|nr:methyltransferase domain-containing protein [Anaerolineae bacterium]